MVVTTIILIIPSTESVQNRIEEVNKFKIRVRNLDLVELGNNSLGINRDWGGLTNLRKNIFVGSYNLFPFEEFLEYLQKNVKWEEISEVQLLVNRDDTNDINFSFYTHAGGKLVFEADRF